MSNQNKQQEEKPKPEESKDVAPPGASFDTEEGQAAHGMRKDLGGDASKEPEKKENENVDVDDDDNE